MDRLSPNVLLCLFAGVPASVELSEPQDSFRFGVDDDGNVPPRSLKAADLGAQIARAPEIQVYLATAPKSPFGREADARTLKLEPSSPGGLVQALATAAEQSSIGPADFAIQMVKTPESAHFEAPGASSAGRLARWLARRR